MSVPMWLRSQKPSPYWPCACFNHRHSVARLRPWFGERPHETTVSSKYVSLLATALVLIALYTVGCVSFPNFGSLRVGVNLVGDNAFLGVAAIGATFAILSGGIDLSVGTVVAFTSILIAH
jgi:ABC-type xylose transport system permease subunit